MFVAELIDVQRCIYVGVDVYGDLGMGGEDFAQNCCIFVDVFVDENCISHIRKFVRLYWNLIYFRCSN